MNSAPRMLVTAVAAGALVAGSAAAATAATPAIVGGTIATTTYRNEASLQLNLHGDPNWAKCGGTVLSAWFVETNAHCVTNQPAAGPAAQKARILLGGRLTANANPAVDASGPTIYHLRIGSNDRLAGDVVRHVTAITVFPGWNWGVADANGAIGNIALLRLDAPVSTGGVAISSLHAGATVRETGWGLPVHDLSTWDGPLPEFLSQYDTWTLPTEACADAFIATDEDCVGGSGSGICYGDSGSPALQLLRDGIWAAVGSAGRSALTNCAEVGHPDVYTDLWYCRDWMVGVIAARQPQTAR